MKKIIKLFHPQVVTHYAIVYFELMVLDGQDGYIGKHNTLRMIQHASAAIFRGKNYLKQFPSHFCDPVNLIYNASPFVETRCSTWRLLGH